MKSPADTRDILDKLESQHPGADTELHFTTAFELLVATILSAQSTDARVNTVTPALFKRYRDARALARANTADLETQIHSTGFFRAKSKSLLGMAQSLVEQHDGEVPATMEALVALPGVGRKTANVVLGHALGIPGLPVDRHVLRVANRIGIADSDDPIVVEQHLCDAMPPERWTRTSDTLILHGRRICRPNPLCDQCFVRDECDYYRLVVSRERDPRRPGRTKKLPAVVAPRGAAATRSGAGVTRRGVRARTAPTPQPAGSGRTRASGSAKQRKAHGAKRVRKTRR